MSSPSDAASTVKARSETLIARGSGRSYGDSALAAVVLASRSLDRFLEFDRRLGVIKCQAGMRIADILKVSMRDGWFIPVTPGTHYVTIGGAIAGDVHGKNHHRDGTFGQHVLSITILLGNGEIVAIDPQENPELFHATCGGMGLTGVILDATLKLKAISSFRISQTTLKADCLESVLEAFEANHASTYSVAWIDCLASGRHLGRSLLMLGEHASDGDLAFTSRKEINIPLNMPAWLLNEYSMRAFNQLYYAKTIHARSTATVSYESFFYPLDRLSNWNRLYGRQGFIQYQFVIPRAAGISGLREIIERIVESGKGSFLAVLKVFGAANDNLLSFPIDGYTLALDFKAEAGIFPVLEELDEIVLEHGGRLYLCKDARMSEATFKISYPNWTRFEEVRAKNHAMGRFSSIQSRRLGLQ